MKKTLLIALLLIPFLGIAQTTKPIEGFLGLKFGIGMADVTAAMQAKGAHMFSGKTNDEVAYNHISLGQREAAQLSVVLFKDKMYRGNFFFKPEQEPQILDYYNALVKDISDVYGKGESFKSFKSPYEDGDGHEVTAIAGGYATFLTNWKSENGNTIQVSIRPIKDDLYVWLTYTDIKTQNEVDENDKAKAKADF